jgi:tRNA threonylcarbamoyl adenosine modification protein YeaZ
MEVNIKPTDIDKIMVVNGPGSFTGIRIGLTVAKTISYSLNIPIYTISSLKAYLVSSEIENKMCVIEDSKGYYIGTSEFEVYASSLDDYKNYNKVENKLNILKIMEYINTLKPVNVHGVKANYVKVIEALK